MTSLVRTHQVLVQAPLQGVFDYVSDLARHPEWSEGELRIEAVEPGPIAVGKEYRSRGQVAAQKNRPNTVRVTGYEPPHRFAFAANDPDFGTVTHEFSFNEQSGSVLIQRKMTVNLNPLVALAFRFLIYPLVGRPAMDKSLALLKARLEEYAPG